MNRLSGSSTGRNIAELFIDLHRLIRSGEGDSERADSVRDGIVDALDTAPPHFRHIFDNLSGDLYQLSGSEYVVDGDTFTPADETADSLPLDLSWDDVGRLIDGVGDVPELAPELVGMVSAEEAFFLHRLDRLRHKSVRKGLHDRLVAEMRGYCWCRLGYHEVEWEFVRYSTSGKLP